MIKEYRKKTTIKAERFDGSDKMAAKYNAIEREVTISSGWLLPTNEGLMGLDIGDWIATGIDGEHWVIADDIFRRTYEEVKQ